MKILILGGTADARELAERLTALKDNDNLRQWINTWLMTVKADGTLDELSQKYRHQPLPPLPVF